MTLEGKGFDAACAQFQKMGYTVEQFEENGVRSAKVSGKGITGGFSQEGSWNRYINGRFAADHEDCFDKWSSCPLVVKFPIDYEKLQGHLDLLASDEGFEMSNGYGYLRYNPFFYEVD